VKKNSASSGALTEGTMINLALR